MNVLERGEVGIFSASLETLESTKSSIDITDVVLVHTIYVVLYIVHIIKFSLRDKISRFRSLVPFLGGGIFFDKAVNVK